MDKLNQQKIYNNLNEISFYFFVVLALTHIISGLLVANEIYLRPAWLINRLLDVPFFIVSFVYIISTIKLKLIKENINSHFFELIAISIGGLITLALIIYDLSIPNQIPTL